MNLAFTSSRNNVQKGLIILPFSAYFCRTRSSLGPFVSSAILREAGAIADAGRGIHR